MGGCLGGKRRVKDEKAVKKSELSFRDNILIFITVTLSLIHPSHLISSHHVMDFLIVVTRDVLTDFTVSELRALSELYAGSASCIVSDVTKEGLSANPIVKARFPSEEVARQVVARSGAALFCLQLIAEGGSREEFD